VIDVLVVSLGTTGGWRAATTELHASLERAGASVVTVTAGPQPDVRTFALTDLVEARAARRACRRGIADHSPAAVIYCSITSALLGPRPGAIWLDSIAAENRPGRHGMWQRIVERRRLERAPLVLPWNEGARRLVDGVAAEVILVPPPVEPSATGEPTASRDIAAITYAGDPIKRRLDFVLESWASARRPDETMIVTGTDEVPATPGVELAGRVTPEAYRALVRRARLFAAAPRREDHGIAALEALADGCMLASTPAPGGYPALEIARALDPRLVSDDLAAAIRVGLDDPVDSYGERAAELLAPFTRARFDRTIANQVLPRLL
jgi:hypothetical protein